MALPFIAGLALGALGVVAYKNRDIIKKKGENIFKDVMKFSEKIYGALVVFVTAFVLGISYFEYLIFYTNNTQHL